jgi:phosphoserine phosphatase
MELVATLVCSPLAPVLTDALLRRAAEALPRPRAPRWLSPSVAADIAFTAEDGAAPRGFADALLEVVGVAGVDAIVQPAEGRRKKLLLADMDSTMIGQECIDELAEEIGKKFYVAAITERAMRGEIAFEPALRERVALLKGLHPDVARRACVRRLYHLHRRDRRDDRL